MTIDTRELIEAVSVLAEDHNIRVTVKSSLRASATVAGTSFVGAMVRIAGIAKYFGNLNKTNHRLLTASWTDRHPRWSIHRWRFGLLNG